MVQNMNDDEDAEETAELLKDLFPDFSYVKRNPENEERVTILIQIKVYTPYITTIHYKGKEKTYVRT